VFADFFLPKPWAKTRPVNCLNQRSGMVRWSKRKVC